MTEPQFFAAIACIAGLLLLLGWLYANTSNPRSNGLLLKSVWLFVLPGFTLWALPDSWFQFPLSLWVVVLIEEGLKTIAALSERNRSDRFWLISLFGILELMLIKPAWGLEHAGLLESWTTAQLLGLTCAAIVTVLMHSVTAEIYAFRWPNRLPLAFGASWVLHTGFNESVGLLGVSPLASLLQLVVLAIIFVALWPNTIRPPANDVPTEPTAKDHLPKI